jgi:hypothetical protein
MTRRIVVRASALVLVGVAVLVALTVYFSTQTVPPCLASGVPKWRAPTDKSLHRFELVVPDRALCFVDQDQDQALVGYVKLPGIEGVSAIAPLAGGRLALRYGDGLGAVVDLTSGRVQRGAEPPPPPSDTVTVRDPAAGVEYVTRRGELGFRVYSLALHRLLHAVSFEGFTWNPRFGPDPPDHGLSLAPDRPELWVIDAPNSVLHVFDVRHAAPKALADIRLTKPLSGDENPCATTRCGRLGWLQHSADGQFVYVGDAGDVIDTAKREEIANLEALHQSRLLVEVDWVDGRPQFPAGVP